MTDHFIFYQEDTIMVDIIVMDSITMDIDTLDMGTTTHMDTDTIMVDDIVLEMVNMVTTVQEHDINVRVAVDFIPIEKEKDVLIVVESIYTKEIIKYILREIEK